ncbi:MAG: redoxin domain-containing protein [Bacteroidales bacterium]|nr:redoxin domain-containing protein [Bacteroidales bacterium]
MKRMNLLKWIALPVSLVAIVGCGGNKTEYTINGTLTDEAFEGANIYMFDIENSSEKLDSAVVTNGSFTFNGKLEKPMMTTLVALSKDNKNRVIDCVLEKGSITIDLDERMVSGTTLNEGLQQMMKDFYEVLEQHEKDYEQLVMLYNESQTSPSKENRDVAKTKYDSILAINKTKEIAPFEKAYDENADNILGAFALNQIVLYKRMYKDINFTQLDSILATATPVVKNFSLITAELESMRNLEKTSVGKPYTDLDLLEGEAMTATKLSQHIDGKVALIDFWASWCGPCREEIPNIAEMHKKYTDKGLIVIGLNVWDKPEAKQKTIEAMNMTWLQLADSTKTATDVYGISGIPHIMLIDKDGTILVRDLRGEAIEAAIVEALK